MLEVIPCGPPIVLHHSPEEQSLTQCLRQSWCDANTHTHTHTHTIGVLLILNPLSPCLLIGGCHWPRSPQKQEESHTLNQKASTYTCALIPTYTMHTCPYTPLHFDNCITVCLHMPSAYYTCMYVHTKHIPPCLSISTEHTLVPIYILTYVLEMRTHMHILPLCRSLTQIYED